MAVTNKREFKYSFPSSTIRSISNMTNILDISKEEYDRVLFDIREKLSRFYGTKNVNNAWVFLFEDGHVELELRVFPKPLGRLISDGGVLIFRNSDSSYMAVEDLRSGAIEALACIPTLQDDWEALNNDAHNMNASDIFHRLNDMIEYLWPNRNRIHPSTKHNCDKFYDSHRTIWKLLKYALLLDKVFWTNMYTFASTCVVKEVNEKVRKDRALSNSVNNLELLLQHEEDHSLPVFRKVMVLAIEAIYGPTELQSGLREALEKKLDGYKEVMERADECRLKIERILYEYGEVL